jgi:hypothetical protein
VAISGTVSNYLAGLATAGLTLTLGEERSTVTTFTVRSGWAGAGLLVQF